MRVLVAFDKFKDALSAPAACRVAGETLRALHPDWEIDLCPLSDGGEGFAEILTHAAGGSLTARPVAGPLGEVVSAAIGIVKLGKLPPPAAARLRSAASLPADATLALIDLASANGLALLDPTRRDPWRTTTRGTGELMRAAAQTGAAAILLGIGGSATNDLGLGALAALGVNFFSPAGGLVDPPVPLAWPAGTTVGGAVVAGLPPILIACDVTNPLLGPDGCTVVYGPQKGLAAGDVPALEDQSARIARLLCTHFGKAASLAVTPGAGAAGGFAFGLMVAADATLLPGFELVADWLDLDRRIAAADLVLTGEGRFDLTSLAGKGPGAVLARAQKARRDVHVFAGSVATTTATDDWLHAITPVDLPLANALPRTSALLSAALARAFPAV